MLLDAGAFLAVERADRRLLVRLKEAVRAGFTLRTNGAVVAQVWRGGDGRQADLARLMQAVDVVPVDDVLGRRAGVLLGMSATGDAVDATLVALGRTGDRIFTSDPDDVTSLIRAGGRTMFVTPC
jgi:hypothetical protein